MGGGSCIFRGEENALNEKAHGLEGLTKRKRKRLFSPFLSDPRHRTPPFFQADVSYIAGVGASPL